MQGFTDLGFATWATYLTPLGPPVQWGKINTHFGRGGDNYF